MERIDNAIYKQQMAEALAMSTRVDGSTRYPIQKMKIYAQGLGELIKAEKGKIKEALQSEHDRVMNYIFNFSNKLK